MKMRIAPPMGMFEDRLGLARSSTLFLGVACGVLIVTLGGSKDLAAGTPSLLGPDYDQDGLADGQEMVLATLPDQVDTDSDGFHDLEELARSTDPLSSSSVPCAEPLAIGMFSYAENGRVNLQTAVYVDGGDVTNLTFELGVFWKGVPLTVAQAVYTQSAKVFLYGSPADPQDKILVLEMPIPDSLILGLGSLSTYARVERLGTPEKAVAITNFVVDPAAGILRIETSPASVQGGRGVVYRPITAGTAPATSQVGQICWQRTAVVGTQGASLVYEVEQANCEDFDSSCSSSACSSAVGGTITLPDPGTLLGG